MIDTLLIDVGNSRIKWRFDDRRGAAPDAVIDATARDEAWRGDAVALADAASLGGRWATSGLRAVDRAFMSNVASDAVQGAIERTLAAVWPAIRIEHIVPTARRGAVSNGYAEPSQLGPDRWLAMIGAHALVPMQSLLVCSLGTATTIDLLAFDGTTQSATFAGGLILPGIDTMRGSLVRETARLDDRRGRVVAFADNTDDAIASGIVAAQVGAIARALSDARARLGAAPTVLLAGGASTILLPFVADADVVCLAVPDLVLRGLSVVARDTLHYDDGDPRLPALSR